MVEAAQKSVFSSQANPRQLEAIQKTDGPLLIIAGPGSGKTFTLVERIVYLITHRQVAPENLFVVTFTDKAAQELTTRIASRLLKLNIRFNLNEMYLGTFHSICLRWLEEYREFTRLKRNFTLMDQFDQQYFLYQRVSHYQNLPGIEHIIAPDSKQKTWDKTANLLRWLNVVSEEALDAQTLVQAEHDEIRALGHAYTLYQQQLDEENALDFSTIQYEALKLLRSHPQVLAKLRMTITYLMVDEYQDTNTVQEQLLNLLAGDQPNLCVVGDDDQGLYRFRGATIRNILQFKNKFSPGQCEQVTLKTNYRSHPDIVRFYNHWMNDQVWSVDGQSFRFDKQIEARDDDFTDVPCVIKVAGPTPEDWHQEMLDFLHHLRDQGHLSDWNQVAFLFRSVKNNKVVALAQFLEENGIPVYSPRSNQFFDREEIKLMIGALIFLFPQFPKARKWADDAQLGIWQYYDQECVPLFAQELHKPKNEDLLKWARSLAKQHMYLTDNTNYAFSGLFYQLLRFPLFSRYLDENLMVGGVQDGRPMRNLAILSQLLVKFEYLQHLSILSPQFLDKSLRNLFNQFFRFLSEGGINEYEDDSEYAPSGCVSFLTIHQSKGLEFPVVIVGSLNASPRKQHSKLDEILEDGYLSRPTFEPLEHTKYFDFHRLYYTAYSRAQNLLVLSCVEKGGRGRTPSKHFADYYNELSSWRDRSFDTAALPLDQVKDVNLKREYSFTSHLVLFENCAEQYRFFKELEFSPVRKSPILFGTLVHQTIEDIHKTVLRGQEHKLSVEQIESWFDTNYAYLTKRERVYLSPVVKKIALEHVLRYYRRNGSDWSRVKEAEVDVSLVKDEYILSGSVDLIQGEEDTVEIVDFKSEKKLDVNDPKDRDKLDRYRRQLEVYAHIVEERTGFPVSKMHLYYTSEENGNPYISFMKDRRSIDVTIQTFADVVGRIELKDFRIPARPEKACKECDMQPYCDAKNWIFRGEE